jgi:hypothetical protein
MPAGGSKPLTMNLVEQNIRDHLEDIALWKAQGFSTKQIATRLGISKGHLYVLLRKMKDFKEAWECGNAKLLDEFIEPLIKKRIEEGFNYTEITRERINGKMVITKEVEKCNISNSLLLAYDNRLDNRWKQGNTEVTVVESNALDPSMDEYGG